MILFKKTECSKTVQDCVVHTGLVVRSSLSVTMTFLLSWGWELQNLKCLVQCLNSEEMQLARFADRVKKKKPKKTTTSIYSMIKKACFLTLSFVFYLYLFSLHMLIERSGVVPVFLKHKRTCIKVFVDPSFVCFTSVLLEFTLHWRFEHLWFLKVDKYLSYLLPLRYGWLR